MNYIFRGFFRSLALLLISLIFSQRGFSQKDTAFLYREVREDWYQAIYKAKNHSSLYNSLAKGFRIRPDYYNEVLQQIKDSSGGSVKHLKINFPDEWYSLHQYKGKTYFYLPAEPHVNTFMKISDSTLILNYFNDGCIPALLQKVDVINPQKLIISTYSLYKEESQIIFHFFTGKRDIAVVEYPLREKNKFELMAAKKSLSKYPLIVNFCRNGACNEWTFDTIDYKKLLR